MIETGLDGKVALITGGSRGIGKAVAAALLDAEASVLISSRKKELLDAAVEELSAAGGGDRIAAFVANAGDQEQARACVDAAIERFGSVDILVNNAATNPYFGPLMGLDVSRAEKTVAVNQLGPLLWTQLVWERSMADRGGAIVNVASIGANRVEDGFAFYNVTKAALVHLTRHLANELAPTVRVNAVAPGVVKTDLSRALWESGEAKTAARIPLGRLGAPEDIGQAVRFLVSSEAAWITGETLVIDGGTMVQPSALVADDPAP